MIQTDKCTLCPRNCNSDRIYTQGYCKSDKTLNVAKIMLHKWEEPAICHKNGSGAVFFTGCQMHCVFCQNHNISAKSNGKTLNEKDLADIFLQLQEKGACNINLVSPTPYTNEIIKALELAKANGLIIPIVFNSGGYEKRETIKRFEGLVDIYLPDFKFFSPTVSKKYANADNYSLYCKESLTEMYRQTGDLIWEGDHLEKGLIVRHLPLPNNTEDSIEILKCIKEILPPNKIILSLLRQYTPMYRSFDFPELSRPITTLEYQKVVRFAEKIGFNNLYTQKKDSIGEKFVPDFSVFSEENN